MKGARAMFAVLMLAASATATALFPTEAVFAQGGLSKKPAPLEYEVFGLTLEASPRKFRQAIKRNKYLLTTTKSAYGCEVMSFTSSVRNRLFPFVFVAFCPSTGQTAGIYLSGEDGESILAMAKNRFHITGNDLATMPAGSSVGGPMRIYKKYRKDYPNVSVSFYKNTPYESYTLALESKEALLLCARQNSADGAAADELSREIEAASRKAAAARVN